MTVELLYFDGCPNHELLEARLRELVVTHRIDVSIESRRIVSQAHAERERFLGSPTVRVNGRDIDPRVVSRTDFALQCRVYATPDGLRGVPPDEWLLGALADMGEER